ncbi:MAG: PDZ domain-containing protein [Chitinophagaceae bacterium]|nr:PDZ domain-containing protein [Chitinophagaceae bacterium]
MKQYFIQKIIAGILLITVPASLFAQKEKQKEKIKNDKDVQQIIITRKGDTEGKTVIEIKGDKITINGKDVKDVKDVTVHLNNLKGIRGQLAFSGPQGRSWNFDFNDGFTNLFREDSNRAMLGVVTDRNDKGAEISEVSEGSAAAKAGLKKGDIITKIDDMDIEDAEDVSEAVRAHKPGEKVNITILRDDREQKLTAELGKWKGIQMNTFNIAPGRPIPPDTWQNMPRVEATPFDFRDSYIFNSRPRLGLSIQDTEDGKGVKVLEVQEESNAAKAGVQKNDVITHVNGTEVNSADEVSRIVRETRDKNSIALKVLRNGKTYNLEVRTPRKLKTTEL